MRLVSTMALLGILIVLTGFMGIYGMKVGNHALEEVYSNQLASSVAISNSKNSLSRARFTLDRAVLHPDAPDVGKTLDRAAMFVTESDQYWQAYLALPRDVTEEGLARDLDEKRKRYRDEGLLALRQAVSGHDMAQADLLSMKKLQELFAPFGSASDKLDQYQLTAAKAGFDRSNDLFSLLFKLAIGGVVAGALLIVVSSAALLRAILRPLDHALAVFGAMARGDLSSRIATGRRDEMGRLLEGLAHMQEQLVGTVRNVRAGSAAIATASQEIATGNIDLSRRTEQQAGSLEETASSLEELTSAVRHNADNARQANQLAVTASDIATQGGQLVSQVVTTMGAINHSSKRIVDIISVIDGIAFQTNILALNAAVEAARAGEQGRGFAVVASEVRNLAQRSAAAAKEIKELITASVDSVDAGAALVDQAGATMEDIVASVARVTDIMSEIMAAGSEQSSGIEQINQAVAQMDETTQRNAALVEQAAAAADSLQEQAVGLEQLVSVFKLDEADQRGRLPPRQARLAHQA
ncbi:HAMP domain-containing protein [Pseudoduganella sp. FT26W]|uniref:HAMP domain-containing protein n=2 Tax=Duganella aquatilis TaxID=2666082 RepID=A0A844DAN4_9BURK|nr:HAMP domain-containing protein [Duganella aquatilis]